jgi:hypothetical protein
MIPTKLQIKAFEDVLDSSLSQRAIFGCDANEALLLAGNIVESLIHPLISLPIGARQTARC